MGRGRSATNENVHAGVSSRAHGSANGRLLRSYEMSIGPLVRRFAASSQGSGTLEEQNRARARAVRALPVDEQRKLISVAQGCTAIIENCARSVSCPSCGAAQGDPCLTDNGRPRYHVHRERLTLAKSSSHNRQGLGEVTQAERINNQARELFVFSHTGAVMQMVRPQVGVFETESNASALEVLSQEAYMALDETMDMFQLSYTDNEGRLRPTENSPVEQAGVLAKDSIKRKAAEGDDTPVRGEATPLTYAKGRMRHRIGEAKELGQTMVVKSRMFDKRVKVEKAVKDIRERGAVVTLAEVSALSGVEEGDALQLMRTLAPKARLDAPLPSARFESADTIGSVIPDQGETPEDSALSHAQRSAVREAAQQLPPFARKIIEAQYAINGGEDVQQKDLYDGVYRDVKTGKTFSSKKTIVQERSAQGVEHLPQREIDRRFADGGLVFDAATPEAFELAMLRREDVTGQKVSVPRADRVNLTVTKDTGLPMTATQIQEAKEAALWQLSRSRKLDGLRPRYRGDHEIESSEQARQQIRRALIIMGDLHPSSAEKVKAGRPAADGTHQRGELVKKAAERGWVDETTGRVHWRQVKADLRAERTRRQAANKPVHDVHLESSDELAQLMQEA